MQVYWLISLMYAFSNISRKNITYNYTLIILIDKFSSSYITELTMSFKNKVVLITGASSGIGAAAAIEFAKQGAKLAIVGRNVEKLRKVASNCDTEGSKPLVIIADIALDDEAKAMVQRVIDKFGQLDVLVNNAGIAKHGSILHGNILDAYDSTMKVNVRAHINITTLCVPHLIKTKGNIINISSICATLVPNEGLKIPYYVSKAALNHFSRGAAAELAGQGVRVNTISPGPVITDFFINCGITSVKFEDVAKKMPLKRVSEPIEIADIILFLASDKSVGITGSDFVVDNGYLLQ